MRITAAFGLVSHMRGPISSEPTDFFHSVKNGQLPRNQNINCRDFEKKILFRSTSKLGRHDLNQPCAFPGFMGGWHLMKLTSPTFMSIK